MCWLNVHTQEVGSYQSGPLNNYAEQLASTPTAYCSRTSVVLSHRELGFI